MHYEFSPQCTFIILATKKRVGFYQVINTALVTVSFVCFCMCCKRLSALFTTLRLEHPLSVMGASEYLSHYSKDERSSLCYYDIGTLRLNQSKCAFCISQILQEQCSSKNLLPHKFKGPDIAVDPYYNTYCRCSTTQYNFP